MKTNRIYTQAPLPFLGQKKNFLKDFRSIIRDEFYDRRVFVDLFGGSGLLSHTVKRMMPEATVIYNDYDNYEERLCNIPITNKILADLRVMLKDYPADKRLTPELKKDVVRVLKKYDEKGYVDYLTLSSSLLYTMNYVDNFEDMKNGRMYNFLRKSDCSATGYLDGLEIVRRDYRLLFDTWKLNKDAVFLVDPPYLSTECSAYKSYWRLSEYLDVLNILKEVSYIYFTSNKSHVLELCEWIGRSVALENPLHGAGKREVNKNIGVKKLEYTDIMLYKNFLNVV